MSKNKLASSNISININKLAQIVVKELKKDNYIFNVLNIYEWPPKGKKLMEKKWNGLKLFSSGAEF